MRPQLILYRVLTALLLFSSIVVADQFYSPLKFGIKMRESLLEQSVPFEKQNFATQSSLSRLTSYVLELSYGDLLNVSDLRTQEFPEQQLACQRAITHGSIAYARKWIDATERGMTPEAANRLAARQLEGVNKVCNVQVVENAAGTRVPSAGGPCWESTSHVFVDPSDLRECLQQTLEFWTSYLYIPANQ